MKKLTYLRDYREARKSEYPDIGDQLDALWKMARTIPQSGSAKEILDRIDAVKSKYPKPK